MYFLPDCKKYFIQNSLKFDKNIQRNFYKSRILYKIYFTNAKECDIIELQKITGGKHKTMKKVIIMEGNAETAEEIAVAVRMAGLEVAGVTNDGEEGLKMIGIEKPDVAVIGLVLKGIDGFGVLERVQREHAAVKLIVTGGYSDDAIIEKVLATGAKYYLMKPIAAEVVAERVKEVAEGEKGAAAAKEKKNAVTLDEKISNIFISIGIPPHIKGYGYLREGIKLAVERPGIINNVTKELYPQIAEKFNTTASKVERAIRHSIEVAWNRQRIEAINAVFGVRVYIGSDKPTNSEFIALVADKLILEGIANYR